MTDLEAVKQLEQEQRAEYYEASDRAKKLGFAWVETRDRIKELEKQAEVERLVAERLAAR